jgi:hypothetical protein
VTEALGPGSAFWSRGIERVTTLRNAKRIDVSASCDLEAKPVTAPRPA